MTLVCIELAKYMFKTPVARDPSTALKGFTIHSLAATIDKSEPDRILCSVRARQYYLKPTELLRAGRNPLFLPLRST